MFCRGERNIGCVVDVSTGRKTPLAIARELLLVSQRASSPREKLAMTNQSLSNESGRKRRSGYGQ